MKKFILGFILVLSAFVINAQELEKSVSAIHKDVTSSVSTVYTDATKATSAVYTDATKALETVYPDAKGVVSTLYEDAKSVASYITPKIEGAITALATTLKTTTAQVWHILVYKQMAEAVTQSIIVICLLICMIIVYRTVRKWLSNVIEFDIEHFLVIVACCVGGVLSLIYVSQQLPIIVNGFMIPEYGAMQELIKMTNSLLSNFR